MIQESSWVMFTVVGNFHYQIRGKTLCGVKGTYVHTEDSNPSKKHRCKECSKIIKRKRMNKKNKTKVEYCKKCKYLIKPDNMCICSAIDKKTEETLIKIRKTHLHIINELAKSNPSDYITTEFFYESGFKYEHSMKKKNFITSFLEFPIGLFRCPGCGRIITHLQYRFSRCCGSCDTGRRTKPNYKIITKNDLSDEQ